MPFRDKSRLGLWRAQVKRAGRIYRANFETKRQAVEWEIEKRRELEAESQRATWTGMGLVDFCNAYLDDARLRFVPKTYDNKRRLCGRFLGFLGNIPVAEVTPKHILDFLSNQAAGKSTSRFNEDYKHLRAMWTWGEKILDLPNNPAAKVRRLPHNRAPQYTPPTEDILKVLAAATREERIFLNCYLNTGARKSEIFRWQWPEDINFERRQVRLGTRKTRDGAMEYEWLPMNEPLYEELWSWWKNRPIKHSPYVFVSTGNRHYGNPFTTRRQFMSGLCKRAGVKPFGFHALRRYVASYLADECKVSSKSIQRILRHKNLATTERYVEKINRDLQEIMNLLGHTGYQTGYQSTAERSENTSKSSE